MMMNGSLFGRGAPDASAAAGERMDADQTARLRGRAGRDAVAFGLGEILNGIADAQAGLRQMPRNRHAAEVSAYLDQLSGYAVTVIGSLLTEAS